MKICPECKREYQGPERFCPLDGTKLLEQARRSEDPLLGVTVHERYQIRATLGQGPSGRVYLAEHALLGTRYALKVLRPELGQDEGRLATFRRHAAQAARADIDHVLAMHDFGAFDDGGQYVVTDLAEGATTLAQLLAKLGRLPTDVALAIAIQLAATLDRTHAQGIAHGGLKPTNVFLLPQRRDHSVVLLSDFGLPLLFPPGSLEGPAGRPDFFAAPEYLAPEQLRGEGLDPRSDIHGLGVLLYQMLVGQAPLLGDSTTATVARVLHEKPSPLTLGTDHGSPQVPGDLAGAVLQALAKTPGSRFATMTIFGRVLAGIQEEERTRSGGGEYPEEADTILQMPGLTPAFPTTAAAPNPAAPGDEVENILHTLRFSRGGARRETPPVLRQEEVDAGWSQVPEPPRSRTSSRRGNRTPQPPISEPIWEMRALDETRTASEAEARRRVEQEAEAARQQAERAVALQRQAEQEAEAARQQAEREAAQRRQAEQEAEREARQQAERAAAQRRQAEQEAEAARQQAEREAARQRQLEQEAEAARQQAEQELARSRQAEQEAAARRAEQEATRRRHEEEASQRKAEQEAARRRSEEEASQRKAEQEAARRRAEEEARQRAEEEARRLVEEKQRKKQEKESRRKSRKDGRRGDEDKAPTSASEPSLPQAQAALDSMPTTIFARGEAARPAATEAGLRSPGALGEAPTGAPPVAETTAERSPVEPGPAAPLFAPQTPASSPAPPASVDSLPVAAAGGPTGTEAASSVPAPAGGPARNQTPAGTPSASSPMLALFGTGEADGDDEAGRRGKKGKKKAPERKGRPTPRPMGNLLRGSDEHPAVGSGHETGEHEAWFVDGSQALDPDRYVELLHQPEERHGNLRFYVAIGVVLVIVAALIYALSAASSSQSDKEESKIARRRSETTTSPTTPNKGTTGNVSGSGSGASVKDLFATSPAASAVAAVTAEQPPSPPPATGLPGATTATSVPTPPLPAAGTPATTPAVTPTPPPAPAVSPRSAPVAAAAVPAPTAPPPAATRPATPAPVAPRTPAPPAPPRTQPAPPTPPRTQPATATPAATKPQPRPVPAPTAAATAAASGGQTPAQRKEEATRLLGVGRGHLRNARYDEARAAFSSAQKLDGGSAAAASGLGEVAFQLGNFQEAARHQERAVQLNPNNDVYRTFLGNSYFKLRDYRRAIDNWNKALQLNPKNDLARTYIKIAEKKLQAGG